MLSYPSPLFLQSNFHSLSQPYEDKAGIIWTSQMEVSHKEVQ